jgi:hypothetical protein
VSFNANRQHAKPKGTTSMPKLILAGKHQLFPLLCQGSGYVPEPNCSLLYVQTKLTDVIPLSWIFQTAVVYAESFGITDAAAEILHIKDRYYDWNGPIKAQRGDVIIVLPSSGELGSSTSARSHLMTEPVTIVYVGAALSTVMSHVFKRIDWRTFRLYNPTDLLGVTLANKHAKVSIFDAVRLRFRLPQIEEFQRRCFPGRTEVTLGELANYLDNEIAERLVREKLRNLHKETLTVFQQLMPLAEKLQMETWVP